MKFLSVLLLIATAYTAHAQQTVGVFKHDSTRAYAGYTLFAPIPSRNTYLIDNNGQVVKSWRSQNIPGMAVMLLDDGTLLRTGNPFVQVMGGGGAGGIIEKFSWDGALLWRYEHLSNTYRSHHDVESLPNGNVLLMVWELHTRAEAIARGRDPKKLLDSSIYVERIIEVKQTGPTSGEVVWSWSAWDHIIQDFDESKLNYGVVSEQPERIDINTGSLRTDWLHFNSIRYSPKRDEILISALNLDEVFIISRATGNIKYRWGNPANYKRGTPADQMLFGQHDARWTDSSGKRISLFNNGVGRTATIETDYSTVDEFDVPLMADGTYSRDENGAYGPSALAWTYPEEGTTSFFGINISGAVRLPNGNMLACVGPKGILSEVTNNGEEVWRYVSPVGDTGAVAQGVVPRNNLVFKVLRFGPDHPAIAGRPLTPKGLLERPSIVSVDERLEAATLRTDLDILGQRVSINVLIGNRIRLDAYDLAGRWLGIVVDDELTPGTHIRNVPKGTYLVH